MENPRGRTIHMALQYIEDHLHEELSVEAVASAVSTSKYHFHRLFHASIGTPLGTYIRNRRLANAASELITTERRILEIALEHQFDSQEAFTRAFRKQYHMTPGLYRSFMTTLIQKRELTRHMDKMTKEPKGWMLTGTHPSDYEMGIDMKITHQGKASGTLRGTKDHAGGFATMMQIIQASRYRGQRLQYSGFLKTEDVEHMCGLWMRVDGKDQEILQFDNMSNRPVSGTTPWRHYQVVLDVPHHGEAISFGVLLAGKGQVWADSLRFDVVDDKVPTTNLDDTVNLPEFPVNLSFDELE
ncbi:helix-turn-helix domain-containing protein [Gorillibacterium sp. CAU 1737]|uniref:helix-turn-helix domain-containing protein n=1 Tax=Gorillibacterium sp. CAU 1737 TaxID=3140362 RepID=UPI003260F41B